jgi:hypothetical protein
VRIRHAHAYWLLAGGSDLKSVMDRMGHAQITTTDVDFSADGRVMAVTRGTTVQLVDADTHDVMAALVQLSEHVTFVTAGTERPTALQRASSWSASGGTRASPPEAARGRPRSRADAARRRGDHCRQPRPSGLSVFTRCRARQQEVDRGLAQSPRGFCPGDHEVGYEQDFRDEHGIVQIDI